MSPSDGPFSLLVKDFVLVRHQKLENYKNTSSITNMTEADLCDYTGNISFSLQ
jgi:hypothetical protein